TIWFFKTAFRFDKVTKIENITFEYTIEYKELVPETNIPDNEPDYDHS
ncbi:31321_t:CDS:1, partial [Racocetra persica]